MVEVRVQTMFREMETQTFPWSPPYVQISRDEPEILLLNYLKWGDGLPAGKHEVEEITRNRKKRAWDMFLSSLQKSTDINFKRKIISQIESDDWEFIEKDLEKINEERMVLAKKVLEEQRADFISKSSVKIDKLNKNLLGKYEQQVKRIEFEKDKELRRINHMTKKKFVDRHEHKTIIDTFTDRLSDLYAFRVRLGFQRKNTSVVLCNDAYDMIQETNTKKPHKFVPPNRAGKTKKHNCIKDKFVSATDAELNDYFRMLEGGIDGDKTLHTNDIRSSSVKCEDKLKFSKQADVVDSKADDELCLESQDNKDEDLRQMVLQTFKQTCLEKYKKDTQMMTIHDIENNLVAKLLDITSKENQRMEEEKKIIAMALIAQAERWRREAQEAGIRQKQMIREAIKKRILEQALEKIDEDIQNQFVNILRDSLVDTAVTEAEEELRVKLYEIDRNNVPKTDEGYQLEEMILQLREQIDMEEEEGESQISTLNKDYGSMSDFGEIIDAVNDLYEEIITIALELDELVTMLSDSNVQESKFHLVEGKLEQLLNNENNQPGLESLKNHMINAYTDYTEKQNLAKDIVRMDKLCDSIIELADKLYDIVIGDSEISEILEDINDYSDVIVNDEFLKKLDKNTSRYIFKLMKISHILDQKSQNQLLIDINDRIKSRAKNICLQVSKIAVKFNDILFNENMETESVKSEIQGLNPEEEIEKEDSFLLRVKQIKMEKLCDKLLGKKINKKTKKVQTEKTIEDISIASSSKIDVCKIKEEAAEIIESIVDVWLMIDSLLEKLSSSKNVTQLQEEIMGKLSCIIEKLEEQFADIDNFPGFRLLLCTVEPSECKDLSIIDDFMKHPPEAVVRKATNALNSIFRTAVKLHKFRQIAPLNFRTLRKVFYLREPLKSDLVEMVKHPERYPTIQNLIDSSTTSSSSSTLV